MRAVNRQQFQRKTLDRRTWLKASAMAAVGGSLTLVPQASPAADDAKARAKKNIKLGVDAGPYTKFKVDEAARRIRDDGFSCVLTNYTFADTRFDPSTPDWAAAKRIVEAFERNGIRIAAAFGYFNVVDPVLERRRRGEARMACLIENWKRLGCATISTETGTFNAQSEWADAPENATDEGYQKCRAAFESLARMAEKAGAVVSIEPYWRNVILSIERAERLFRDIQSPGLRLVMDPCNYPRKEDLPQLGPMLDKMFRRLGDKIVVAHAKDVKAGADGTDLPAAGRGVLDYPRYLRLLAGLNREMSLLVEHVALDDVPRARDYVLAQLEKL